MQRSPEEFTFLDHLDELRGRLIKILSAFIIMTFIFSFFVNDFLRTIIKPVGKIVYTSPSDAFLAQIVLALFGGFCLTLPVLIYQAWGFVASGLKEREGRLILAYAPASIFLFLLGGVFAYFIAIPVSLRFLLGFSTDYIVPMITIRSYISFVGTLILAFGVVFELPLILLFLTRIGIATPAFLIQKRRHAIVLILIVSAIITPPDVVTQIIMAVPLIILYEIGIAVSRFVYRKRFAESGLL